MNLETFVLVVLSWLVFASVIILSKLDRIEAKLDDLLGEEIEFPPSTPTKKENQ